MMFLKDFSVDCLSNVDISHSYWSFFILQGNNF